MIAHTRHDAILKLLEKRGRLAFRELLATLPTSPATLRRDLSQLEDNGLLMRSHGGVHHPGVLGEEPSIALKKRSFMDRKCGIASMVAEAVPGGSLVFLDSGSTCLEVSRRLRRRCDVTIVTNSLPVLAGYRQAKCRIMALGGEVRTVSGALVGEATCQSIRSLRADIAILGASGVSRIDGASTTEPGERAVKQAMIQRSRSRWLAVDSSKVGKEAGFPFGNWEDFEHVFTDQRFPAETTPYPKRIHICPYPSKP